MPLRSFLIFFSVLVFSTAVSAQNFDGRYDGNLLLTRDGGDCGSKAEKFQAEVKGKSIRIVSPRGDKPFEGEIADGQFFASGPGRNKATLEWRGQILATKSALGSMLLKTGNPCQFLLSLKRI
jgi:hypothetical protein